MISLNHTIAEGYAEEVTNTVKDITGHNPISFKQFVGDNKPVWV